MDVTFINVANIDKVEFDTWEFGGGKKNYSGAVYMSGGSRIDLNIKTEAEYIEWQNRFENALLNRNCKGMII